MANLTKPRDPKPHRPDEALSDPVKAGVKLIKGAMYGLDANGWAVKMETGVAAKARGEVLETVDNTAGANGDKRVHGRAGTFELHMVSGDEPTRANLLDVVYFEDDHTVGKTSDGGARPEAGKLLDLTSSRAVVQVGPVPADGDLIASNNLSDVGNAATARANLVANRGELFFYIADLAAAAAYRLPLPDRVVTIAKIKTVIDGALTVGDATVTAAINTTDITGGAITITQSGSAAGDQDEVSPSALNVSDGADDYLRLTVAGTNTANVGCGVCVEYTW